MRSPRRSPSTAEAGKSGMRNAPACIAALSVAGRECGCISANCVHRLRNGVNECGAFKNWLFDLIDSYHGREAALFVCGGDVFRYGNVQRTFERFGDLKFKAVRWAAIDHRYQLPFAFLWIWKIAHLILRNADRSIGRVPLVIEHYSAIRNPQSL